MTDEAPKKKRRALFYALQAALLVCLIIAGVVVYRGWRFPNRQLSVPAAQAPEVDWDAAAKRLSDSVRIQTISRSAQGTRTSPLKREDAAAFRALFALMARSYPKTHAALERQIVAEHSLLYVWEGAEPGLPPVLLAGHLDVSTVAPGTQLTWTEPPFSGAVKEGVIWGRGTLDDKAFAFGVLEAVESLLTAGQRPRRTVLIALSHDQLRGGEVGARELAKAAGARAERFHAVIAEGMAIVQGFMPEVPAPIALVGVGEKGLASYRLRSESEQAMLRASEALKEAPLPAVYSGPAVHQFEFLASELPFAVRLALANPWLFSGMLEGRIEGTPGADALIRTLVTSTSFPPGYDEATLPKGSVTVTYRLRPGDSLQAVREHAAEVLKESGVKLEELPGAYPAPPSSPIDSEAFHTLHETIKAVFPEAVVAPSLALGSTDARHYQALSSNLYRFRPLLLGPADVGRTRGADERIRTADYQRVVGFYHALLSAL